MATNTRIILNRRQTESAIQEIAGGPITLSIDANYPHTFVGVSFYSDSSGTPASPSSGTVTVTAETIDLPGEFQAVTAGSFNPSSNKTVGIGANVSSVRVEFASIAGASHAKIICSSNLS